MDAELACSLSRNILDDIFPNRVDVTAHQNGGLPQNRAQEPASRQRAMSADPIAITGPKNILPHYPIHYGEGAALTPEQFLSHQPEARSTKRRDRLSQGFKEFHHKIGYGDFARKPSNNGENSFKKKPFHTRFGKKDGNSKPKRTYENDAKKIGQVNEEKRAPLASLPKVANGAVKANNIEDSLPQVEKRPDRQEEKKTFVPVPSPQQESKPHVAADEVKTKHAYNLRRKSVQAGPEAALKLNCSEPKPVEESCPADEPKPIENHDEPEPEEKADGQSKDEWKAVQPRVKPNINNLTIAGLLEVDADELQPSIGTEAPSQKLSKDCPTSEELLMPPPVSPALIAKLSKKPNLHDITIAKLLSVKETLLSSPVSGGNLKASPMIEDLPNDPPSSTSTMSKEELAGRLRDFHSSTDDSGSTLKHSTTSADNLLAFEPILTGQTSSPKVNGSIIKFQSVDSSFIPTSLALGRKHLFVASSNTNMVGVFKNEAYVGVLKMNGNRKFTKLKHIFFVGHGLNFLVILDDAGFHIFTEDGSYRDTILSGEGRNYRGMAVVSYHELIHLVTLDISGPGVNLVLIDLKGALSRETFISKEIPLNVGTLLNDNETKCRFLAITEKNEVLVSSMMKNAIFCVDLANGGTRTFQNDYLNQPTGIAVCQSGYILVSSANAIEVFGPTMARHGALNVKLDGQPLGLCFDSSTSSLFIACKASILKVELKF